MNDEWGTGWDGCRPHTCAREGCCRHRYRRQPWYDAAELMRVSPCTSWDVLADRLGLARKRLHYLRVHGIPEPLADQLANKLGLHPSAVFGEAWWYSAAAEGGYNESAPAPRERPGACPATSVEGARTMHSTGGL